MGEARPPEFYRTPGGGAVLVPARICALLARYAGLDQFRVANRGVDAECDAVLVAMRLEALEWGSRLRTEPANEGEQVSESEWVTARAAADQLRCTPRAVQKACLGGRLRGRLVGGRWLIDRTDLEHYRAARSRRG